MLFIGFDIGSISSKLAVLDENNKLIYSDYQFNNGNPLKNVLKIIKKAQKNKIIHYNSICTTGSGRNFIGRGLSSDLIKNEITATWKAITTLYPKTRTIIEIGGQDSKLITLNNGEISDFKLNSVCAAGTGSFIQQQANRLGISINKLSDLAMSSDQIAKFSGRCAVFVETEMINLQQNGYSLNSIAAGLFEAICDNYLKDLTPAMKLLPDIIFCGGVSVFPAIQQSFEKKLKTDVIVPQINKITAAYGAALLAKKYYTKNKNSCFKKEFKMNKNYIIPLNRQNCKNSKCLNCGQCSK